jgi:hypothetical protein
LLAACLTWDEREHYSFANTPLKAAHPPLAIASKSHAGLLCGRDMAVPADSYAVMVLCNGLRRLICKVPVSITELSAMTNAISGHGQYISSSYAHTHVEPFESISCLMIIRSLFWYQKVTSNWFGKYQNSEFMLKVSMTAAAFQNARSNQTCSHSFAIPDCPKTQMSIDDIP